MNILYLTNHLNIGGITSYVLTLGAGLKRRGHRVYVASGGGQLLSRFIEEGIIYIPTPINTKQEASPKIILSMFKLGVVIKEYGIQILHSNSRTTQVLGTLLGIYSGIPHISTCHGFFKKRFIRKLFPCWGKRTIAISEEVKRHLHEDFLVKEKDIAVIPNGIDINSFSDTEQSKEIRGHLRKNLGLSDNDFVVGIVARLSDVKGHIYLIQGMKKVIDKYPQASLLIVGEGKMKPELLRLTRELGIERKVFFMPEVYDTVGVLSAMDLFVMPSLKEGLGLALMEAMASGLAVIGSNVGGIKSLIKDGENGLLAEAADSKGLSEAIMLLLEDRERRKFLGNNAQIFIARHFSQEKMVSQTEEAYAQCLRTKD